MSSTRMPHWLAFLDFCIWKKSGTDELLYSSKVMSKNERKNGAPKAEVFVVVTFVKHFCRVNRREIFWINRH